MDRILEINEKEFRNFCDWYKIHFEVSEVLESVFVTCMCGRFHTYSKNANNILKEYKSLGIVTAKKGIIILK